MHSYVYILAARRGARFVTYVGWTADLDRRLDQHNGLRAGGAKSTRGARWVMLYAEALPDRVSAMSREYHLKADRALRRAIVQGGADFLK